MTSLPSELPQPQHRPVKHVSRDSGWAVMYFSLAGFICGLTRRLGWPPCLLKLQLWTNISQIRSFTLTRTQIQFQASHSSEQTASSTSLLAVSLASQITGRLADTCHNYMSVSGRPPCYCCADELRCWYVMCLHMEDPPTHTHTHFHSTSTLNGFNQSSYISGQVVMLCHHIQLVRV